MSELGIASDGEIARLTDPWSREKLYYIGRYLDIFSTGMKRSWGTLVYADLLSGPGICIDKETHVESPGSPLLAVQHAQFGRLFLNDADQQVSTALRKRVAAETETRVRVDKSDCNRVVDHVREFLFPVGAEKSTLGLAVIDPTGYQMQFESIARLTRDLRLDLIVVFMTSFVRRFLEHPSFGPTMDRFYGTLEWRSLIDKRQAGGAVEFRDLLDVYKKQLQSIGYSYVDDSLNMKNTSSSTIYHLVFASKHHRGLDFFEKIRQVRYSGQRQLL